MGGATCVLFPAALLALATARSPRLFRCSLTLYRVSPDARSEAHKVLDTLQNDVMCKGVPALSQSAKDAFAVGSTEAASRVLTAFARIYPQACPVSIAALHRACGLRLLAGAVSPRALPFGRRSPRCGPCLWLRATDERRDCVGGADGRRHAHQAARVQRGVLAFMHRFMHPSRCLTCIPPL